MLQWSDYDTSYAWAVQSYEAILSANDYIIWYYDQAQIANTGDNYKLAIQYLIGARNYFLNCHRYASLYRFFYNPEWGALALLDMVRAEGNGAEVTMSAVLSAMLTADPDEVQQFVGITDAFMQSIWNRPYNREFYAALGRGFMEWP